jgi:hypothetical protein
MKMKLYFLAIGSVLIGLCGGIGGPIIIRDYLRSNLGLPLKSTHSPLFCVFNPECGQIYRSPEKLAVLISMALAVIISGLPFIWFIFKTIDINPGLAQKSKKTIKLILGLMWFISYLFLLFLSFL